MKIRIFIIAVLIGLVAVVVSFISMGAGHGTYEPARILMPLMMLSTVFHENIKGIYVVLGISQFPIYGIIAAYTVGSKKFKSAFFLLLLAHIVMVSVVFVFHNESFPN